MRVLIGLVACLACLLVVGGCGIGASGVVVTFPPSSVGPAATVSPAVAQTRSAIVAALSPFRLQLDDADRAFRPPESPRLATAPRAVTRSSFRPTPTGATSWFTNSVMRRAAVDAGNELAGYIGTGAGRDPVPARRRSTRFASLARRSSSTAGRRRRRQTRLEDDRRGPRDPRRGVRAAALTRPITSLLGGRRPPRFARESVQHVSTQWMARRQPGVIKVVARIAGHPEALHHGARSFVPRDGE